MLARAPYQPTGEHHGRHLRCLSAHGHLGHPGLDLCGRLPAPQELFQAQEQEENQEII